MSSHLEYGEEIRACNEKIRSWGIHHGFDVVQEQPTDAENGFEIYYQFQQGGQTLLITRKDTFQEPMPFCAWFRPRLSPMIPADSLTELLDRVDAVLLAQNTNRSQLHAELLSVLHNRVTALETRIAL